MFLVNDVFSFSQLFSILVYPSIHSFLMCCNKFLTVGDYLFLNAISLVFIRCLATTYLPTNYFILSIVSY